MEKQEKTIEIPLSVYQNFLKQAEQIAELKQQVEWLTEQFRLARHKQFGASSEQTDDGQLCLFNEAEQTADLTAPEPEITGVKAHYRKKTRLTTDKLPEDLPVEIIRHELPEEKRVCPDCGCPLHKMGEDIREELKIIPAKAVIVRHVRYIYACRHCEERSDHVPIVKAELPNPIIKGGFASPEAVAHIASQKFVMGSPLYRQEQEWAQNGILLSRQTMSNWLVKACEDWLEPIYEEMRRRLCGHQVLHADETTLQVLREDGKSAQSKSYMWLYRTSGEAERQIVLYDYQRDRKHIHPEAFLKDFSGFLHADGYDGYHKLPDRIVVVGCWAHLRRKFDEALQTLPKEKRKSSDAAKGIAYCDRLFHFEKQFALLSPQERRKKREQRSKPLTEAFFAWADSLRALPKSLLGKAVYYSQSQRKYLKAYLLDGRLEISNNRAENSIRPFVMGRKNWLFSNTPNGARTSAVYYSLIVSARENGLVPFEYLTNVFTQAPNGADIESLMPWKV
jgi:transposase